MSLASQITALAGRVRDEFNAVRSALDTTHASLRAPSNMTGGGTLTVSATGEVKWTTRFIVISNGKGAHFGTAGYFDIGPCPAAGTVITGVGTTNVTVTAAGVPLSSWQALYYILPIGGAQTFLAGNLRVVYYTTDLVVPDDWVLVAVNGENGQRKWGNGVIMPVNSAWTVADQLPTKANASHIHALTDLPDAWVKKAVRVATTANITLSGTQTIDGLAVVAGDRVLVKNQTSTATNGIYSVAAGAWTRTAGADTATDIAGATVSIDQGTQGGQIWSTTFKTTDTLGTTAMSWYRVVDTSQVGVSGGVEAFIAAGTTAQYRRGDKTWQTLNAAAVGIASDPAAGTAGLRTLGTGATQAAAGNDARLSDARTPTAHAHAIADLPVAASGESSSTKVVRADDARLAGSAGAPVGSMMMYGGAAAPSGYLLCQGQSLDTTTYAALFAVLGYTYGGSGASFNLPDMRVRVPVGAGTSKALGATDGVAEASRNANRTHSHGHGASASTDPSGSLSLSGSATTGGGTKSMSGATASDGSHSHGLTIGDPNLTSATNTALQGTGYRITGGANHTHSGSSVSTSSSTHSHGISSVSGNIDHTHGLSGSAASHSHVAYASVVNNTTTESPFVSVNYIIKT